MRCVLRRRTFFAFILASAACSRKQNSLKDVLPVQVQREWRLHDAEVQPNSAAPDAARRSGLQSWAVAHYTANSPVTVRLFRFSPGVAFEAYQKWPKTDGISFFKDPYLAVANSPSLSPQELSGFVQDLLTQIRP